MKKILMVGDSVYPDTMGGSHRHIYDISKNLAKKNYHIVVFSPKNSDKALDKELVEGFEIWRYSRHKNKFIGLLNFLFGPLSLFKLMAKTNDLPDTIHGHWPITCFFIWLYVKFKHLPIKLVYTFHGPVVEEYTLELGNSAISHKIFLKIVRKIESYVLKNSDVITTASHYMKTKEVGLYGNADKTVVNYLGIDEKKFDIISPNEYPHFFRKDDFKYIFTLRRLKKRMGIQLLLEAFALVIKEKGNSYKLLIGGKGDYRNELEQMTKKLNIEKNVSFLGFLDENQLKYYYSASDVCVVPSLDLEGFGLTTAEAMACGTPVVATKVCANTEILNEITPDFLVELDSEKMAQAIIAASESNIDKQLLREYVLRTFNLNKTIATYEELYK